MLDSPGLVCGDCLARIEPLPDPLCPTCGEPRISGPSDGICGDCPGGEISFAAARGSTRFSGPAKTLVEKLKYSGRTEYAPIMAGFMAKTLEFEFRSRPFDELVPVPLYRTRRRERGFNQAEVLARELSAITGIPAGRNLLKRIRATGSQTRLSRAQRARNVSGAFAVSRPAGFDGRTLLLIDDVYTTGATLNECARVMRQAGATAVYALTFARASNP